MSDTRRTIKLADELMLAAAAGDVARVASLLGEGADCHDMDNWALLWAAENGHTAVVNLLLDQPTHAPGPLRFLLQRLRASELDKDKPFREDCLHRIDAHMNRLIAEDIAQRSGDSALPATAGGNGGLGL